VSSRARVLPTSNVTLDTPRQTPYGVAVNGSGCAKQSQFRGSSPGAQEPSCETKPIWRRVQACRRGGRCRARLWLEYGGGRYGFRSMGASADESQGRFPPSRRQALALAPRARRPCYSWARRPCYGRAGGPGCETLEIRHRMPAARRSPTATVFPCHVGANLVLYRVVISLGDSLPICGVLQVFDSAGGAWVCRKRQRRFPI
jgi:hypothetical protein